MTTVQVKEALSDRQKKARKLINVFKWLNILAILVTGYLVYLHFKPDASSVCNINETFNCDKVNKSTYAIFLGVPVSIWGMLTYIFMAYMARVVLKGKGVVQKLKFLNSKNILWILMATVLFGVAFSLRLTYVEFAILKAFCIFCLIQQVIIILDMFVLGTALYWLTIEQAENPNNARFI